MLYANDNYPIAAKVEWIGIRPGRNETQTVLENVEAVVGEGLVGDRYSGKSGKRDVTIIQAEHLEVVAKMLDRDSILPALTRRNIVVTGMNLISLKSKRIKIGSAELIVTGPCAPCRKMEANLGPGGYNAMRGHGGITAQVVKTGTISVGDTIEVITA